EAAKRRSGEAAKRRSGEAINMGGNKRHKQEASATRFCRTATFWDEMAASDRLRTYFPSSSRT
ncbi:hypothetical protein, partial [uncultured Sphingopyxis sp.]|uniref:hypothetical protein n=1 Tax=uncultured Sphingopyxis sp. TaxID=310581 RepID=UPI002596E08B